MVGGVGESLSGLSHPAGTIGTVTIGLEFPPWPCVYVIAGGGRRVKIGYSTDMAARLAALQSGSPQQLRILATHLGSPALESWLHKRFGRYRTHGEWFDLSSANLALLLRYMADEEPMPVDLVQAVERKRRAQSEGRKRRAADKRFTGYAPSTGQAKYSKVKVTHFEPGAFPAD